MRRHKTVAELRSMICTPGYYHKRMKKMLRQRAFWQRYVASSTKCTDEALTLMLRYEKKAEYYRKRSGWEPFRTEEKTLSLEMSERNFRMMARDIRGLFNLDESYKRESLETTARLIYRAFNCSVPEEWITD